MNSNLLHRIDLNCDLGELHPLTADNYDEKIMPFISSCNICCAAHSGSIALTHKTINLAHLHKVSIGAHFSYTDKKNFGRLSLDIPIIELKKQIIGQILLVKNYCDKNNFALNHVKPHGALYNDMIQSKELVHMIIEVIKSIDPSLKLYGMANSQIKDICLAHKIKFVNEVFADRVYENQNTLRSRLKENSVIEETENIFKQIYHFINGQVIDYKNIKHKITAESICLHSDTLGAATISQSIFNYLKEHNIEILPT